MLTHDMTIRVSQTCARFAAVTELLLGTKRSDAQKAYDAHWKDLVDPYSMRENISLAEAKQCILSVAKKAIELLEGK